MTPPMGPFPIRDTFGLKAALGVLDRSQDKTGKHEEFVQPNTYRKSQATFSNISRAGVQGLGDVVGANSRTKVWIKISSARSRNGIEIQSCEH